MDLLLLPALALVLVLGLVLFARRGPRLPSSRDRRGRDADPA